MGHNYIGRNLSGSVVFSQPSGGETSVLLTLGHADMEGRDSETSEHDWAVHQRAAEAGGQEGRCAAVGAKLDSGDLGRALGRLVISGEATRRCFETTY